MTDAQPQTQPSPPAPAPKSRWTRMAQLAVGAVVLIVGGITLLNFLVLPGCDADRIQDTVREIFKSTDTSLTVYNNITTISDESSAKMCGAHVETADEKANIEYSVTWQGWTPFVKIENVNTLSP